MKKLLTIATFVFISVFTLFAQTGKTEQEILKLHNSLDQAYFNKDAATFERIMSDDYVYSNPEGKIRNRAESLEEMRKEFADMRFKVLEITSEDLKVKTSGNTAIVTGKWTYTSAANSPDAEPHKDWGRYTGVWEKRGGKWLLVTEHFSEAPHDRQLMQQQVLKAGLRYGEIIKNQDAAAIEMLLADDYIFTNEKGKTKTKAEDVATYKTQPVKFEMFQVSDQKVNVIGNNAAIETGTVQYKGTDKDGKSIEGKERYTTTWVWRGGRWQVAADHVSKIE